MEKRRTRKGYQRIQIRRTKGEILRNGNVNQNQDIAWEGGGCGGSNKEEGSGGGFECPGALQEGDERSPRPYANHIFSHNRRSRH